MTQQTNQDFKVKDFAKAVSVSETTIWKLIRQGDLRTYRIGKGVRSHHSELARMRGDYVASAEDTSQ